MGSCGGRHHYKLRYQHQRQRSAREKELSEAVGNQANDALTKRRILPNHTFVKAQ